DRNVTGVQTCALPIYPDAAPLSLRPRWRELSRRLPRDHRAGMQEVDITVYPNRDNVDVASYIGFRHVTGVLPWPAFEKASFISRSEERRVGKECRSRR